MKKTNFLIVLIKGLIKIVTVALICGTVCFIAPFAVAGLIVYLFFAFWSDIFSKNKEVIKESEKNKSSDIMSLIFNTLTDGLFNSNKKERETVTA